MNVARNLRQEATYWGPTDEDRYGGRGYLAPVVIACRWEERAEQIIAASGSTITSKARVFVDRPLESDGYLALGDQSVLATPDLANADQIMAYVETPDLRNVSTERRVYL